MAIIKKGTYKPKQVNVNLLKTFLTKTKNK